MKQTMEKDKNDEKERLFGPPENSIPEIYEYSRLSPGKTFLDISNSRKRKRSGDSSFTVLQNMRYQSNNFSENNLDSGAAQKNFDLRTKQPSRNSPSAKKIGAFDKKELGTLGVSIAMVSDVDGDRLIHVAVAQENLGLVKKLCILMLKSAISIDLTNYLRQTPLHLAVMVDNIKLTRLLLKYDASVTLRDRNGNSVLHLAVKSGAKEEILQLILSHPHIKDVLDFFDYEGYSALHYAIFKNNAAAVTSLCREGAQMDILDGKSGRSPLMHAILDQNSEMVSLLLECGASTEVLDYSGRSPFEFALHTSNKRISQLLEKKLLVVGDEVLPNEEDAEKFENTPSSKSEKSPKKPKRRSSTRKRTVT